MGITLIIVGGLTLMTAVAAFFDFLGKRKGRNDKDVEGRLLGLQKRVEELESRQAEKDETLRRLEGELQFMNRLIEDKSKEA
jgi:hypothetical protein